MNFCLIFFICNSGHYLIRVIIKHNTMLREHFFIYLTVCEFICCYSVFLYPSKESYFPRKKMTEASASVCLILATTLGSIVNLFLDCFPNYSLWGLSRAARLPSSLDQVIPGSSPDPKQATLHLPLAPLPRASQATASFPHSKWGIIIWTKVYDIKRQSP